jgi:Domain of unknown function (DUF4174)
VFWSCPRRLGTGPSKSNAVFIALPQPAWPSDKEVLDDSERSRQVRAKVSADGKRFQVFFVGKDGHTALSSDQPLSAEYLFAKVDAMPMRRDEMWRGH